MQASARRPIRFTHTLVRTGCVLATSAAVIFGALPARAQNGDAGSPPVASARNATFDHDRHGGLSCTACHGRGERHRSLLVRTPAQCNACHHDTARRQQCLACHGRQDLPEPGALEVRLSLSVWSDARTRRLRFGHDLHSGVACRACHAAPGSEPPVRDCGACHAAHHEPTAECTACHASPPSAAHGDAVHLSCAGRGCHDVQRSPAPALSRPLCLACHPRQQTHEPAGDCALCHQVPRRAPAFASQAGRP